MCSWVFPYFSSVRPILASCAAVGSLGSFAERQWDQQHQVKWEDTRMLKRATKHIQLMVKEVLHIQETPANAIRTGVTSYQAAGWRL